MRTVETSLGRFLVLVLPAEIGEANKYPEEDIRGRFLGR